MKDSSPFLLRLFRKSMLILLSSGFLFISCPMSSFAGGPYPYRYPGRGLNPKAKTVIGAPVRHTISGEETFLDIARAYDLGFNEISDLYPDQDPWVPPEGIELVIPSQWILPSPRPRGIVINIPEMRLFQFRKTKQLVRTFPISIGKPGRPTPTGTFRIGVKEINPVWHIPKSLRKKYGAESMPPGPDNPIGRFWIGLGDSGYGIHGTDIAWSVGRAVTHGCIRLYPEDIKRLFPLAEYATRVEIIYEPVKFGLLSGKIYVEVHKDIYHRISDLTEYALRRLKEEGLEGRVNLGKFKRALRLQDGLPLDVSSPEH